MKTRYSILFCAVLLGWVCNALAYDPRNSDFMHDDSNALGDADYRGCPSVWLNFEYLAFDSAKEPSTADVANDDEILTLRAHFTNARNVCSPYLGHGWQVPLLESAVTPRADGSVNVLLPTGQTLLMPHDKDPLKAAFQTEDGAWKATQEGDVFTLKGTVDQDDWTLRFEKGRVRELKVTDAAPIEWVYKGDYVSQIRLKEGKKTVAFSVSFGADGHPDAFTVSGWQHRFKLSHVALMDDGKAANGGEAASVTANDPGVTLTEWISGEEEDALQHDVFDYGKDEDGHPTLNYNYLDPNEGDLKVALSWDGATGQILTEDDWRYTVKPSQQPGDPPAITRVNDKGEYEYIAVDRARATVMTHLLGKEDTIARFDSDVAWKISTAGEDGVYHTVKRVDFDQYGILRRLGRDEEGALDLEYFNDEHLFHEGPDNDDEKPKPPPVIPADVFKATEALLLANVEGAKGNFQRNNSLEDLARFYIRTGNFKTAFDLASQISDRSLQFEIRELSCAADPKMSAEEKGAWLKVLRKDFPQEDLIGKMLEEYNVQ